ncbi:hypothetical protein [Pseudomonas sp. BN515]|uniref:hypothetical protein n=1 Tax=Pseudomonas sp. BN515 TaxID=2567892 RepID=UPI0024564291|nr:hypothetical protein [Pseudomonas sp. BN515]MDH4869320.1 hypothetical protein [Pseudomonas sp. BN515]
MGKPEDEVAAFRRFSETYQQPCEHAWVNDLAIRCFRDTGDGDYIAARLATRARLPTQALWSGLQALEKYLKCILLLNRISTKEIKHDISKALNIINDKLSFRIALPEAEKIVFDHIAQSGEDRYLIGSFHFFDHELHGLDALVWRLRQYCEPLDVEHYNDSPSEAVLAKSIERIEARLSGPAVDGHLANGRLESILASNDPARDGLVWRNAMFGDGQPIPDADDAVQHFKLSNSPLWLRPELAPIVNQWIHLPKGVISECAKLAKERKTKQ